MDRSVTPGYSLLLEGSNPWSAGGRDAGQSTVGSGGGYAYVALNPDRVELAVFLSLLNVALSVLSAVVARRGQINPFRFPSTSLFAAVALLGLVSLLFR